VGIRRSEGVGKGRPDENERVYQQIYACMNETTPFEAEGG